MNSQTAFRPGFRTLLAVVLVSMWLGGCTSVYTFPASARAGDTVVLPLGEYTTLQRANISVDFKTRIDGCVGTFNSCAQVIATIPEGDPAIRSVINFYPDPVSNLLVGHATGQDFVGQESIWGSDIDAISGQDKDWAQTMLFFDLPATLTDPWVAVDVRNSGTAIAVNKEINILPGTGAPDIFDTIGNGPLTSDKLGALERSSSYSVTFSGSTVPYAIEISLTHDPDLNADPNLGIGKGYVVAARGDVKTTTWFDDGTDMKVILMPSGSQTLTHVGQFKFYVTGGIQNLGLGSGGVQAFDIDGYPVPGIIATITPEI